MQNCDDPFRQLVRRGRQIEADRKENREKREDEFLKSRDAATKNWTKAFDAFEAAVAHANKMFADENAVTQFKLQHLPSISFDMVGGASFHLAHERGRSIAGRVIASANGSIAIESLSTRLLVLNKSARIEDADEEYWLNLLFEFAKAIILRTGH